MNSLFCRKGKLQDKAFCRDFNSYKVKLFARRWDRGYEKPF